VTPLASGAVIDWLNRLATPAIAFAGIAIAFAQLRIANIRLTHDLFDRRYAVYAAARKFIQQLCQKRTITIAELSEFHYASGDAIFVLDQGLADYLEQLRAKAVRAAALSEKIGSQRACQAEIQEHWDLLKSFANQIEILTEKFKPFLQYKRHQWRNYLASVIVACISLSVSIVSSFCKAGRRRIHIAASYNYSGLPSSIRVCGLGAKDTRFPPDGESLAFVEAKDANKIGRVAQGEVGWDKANQYIDAIMADDRKQ
jgi:hypothetical protein